MNENHSDPGNYDDAGELAPSVLNQVYIVDDDSMVRRSLSFSLTIAGFQVRPFASGSDFLDEVDTLLPGCVLLDIRMPAMDGLAVLDKLGLRVHRFAVIAITGHGDVGTAVHAMKRGARDFLEKPFTNDVLIEVLTTLARTLPTDVAADWERTEAQSCVSKLTPREYQVLRGLVGGMPNKTVASHLKISVRTVEMHRAKLMQRMDVKSAADAVRIGILAKVQSF